MLLAERTRGAILTAAPCGSGGIGRRAGLRIQWGNPSGFESRLSHLDVRQLLKGLTVRYAMLARLFCLVALFVGSTALTAQEPTAKHCGSPKAKLAKNLTWAVEKMTVDGDTETQHILEFKSISPIKWVNDEAICQKILATVDKLWPAPRGGPVYVMKVGTDYAVIQGDSISGANPTVMHVDAAFNYIVSIVWQ